MGNNSTEDAHLSTPERNKQSTVSNSNISEFQTVVERANYQLSMNPIHYIQEFMSRPNALGNIAFRKNLLSNNNLFVNHQNMILNSSNSLTELNTIQDLQLKISQQISSPVEHSINHDSQSDSSSTSSSVPNHFINCN